MKSKIIKIVSRAMEDVRGLDGKYPDKEDAPDLVKTLNMILDDAVEKILKLMK